MNHLVDSDSSLRCFGGTTTVGQANAARYKIRRTTLRKVILVSVTLIVLNLRPALAGQVLNEALLLAPLLSLVVLYILVGIPITVTRNRTVLFGLCLSFVCYLVFQNYILAPDSIIPAIQASIVILCISAFGAFFLRQQDTKLVLKTIVYTILLLSLSQAVTYGCAVLSGSPNKLFLGNLISPELAGTPWAIRLYFPLTPTAGFETVFGILFPRATGIFREPGIYQMLINLSFFSLNYIEFRFKNLARFLLLISLFSTLSTAGFVIFLIALLYSRGLRIKKKREFFIAILTIILVAVTSFLVWNADKVGLRYKLLSDTARLENIEETFGLLRQSPVLGFGNAKGRRGINFLGVLQKIGLFGGFLYLMMVSFSIRHNYSTRSFVVYLPLLLTLLFAQPIYEKAFTIFLLFLPIRSLEPGPHQHGTAVSKPCKKHTV